MAPRSHLNFASVLLAVASFQQLALAAPTGTASAAAPSSLLGYNPANKVNTDNIAYSLVPGQSDAATIGAYLDFNTAQNPQPIRGSKGGTDPGPRTEAYDRLNPDKLAPPGTDHGDVGNAQWPLGLSHAKLGLGRGGWSRQQNVDNIPVATEMAGVDMRLEEGAYRELHWHKASEWAYIFNGSVRVEAVNEEGQTFVDDLSAGDVWFFPPYVGNSQGFEFKLTRRRGVPHSLQGLKGGVEFLLVFDDGSFSEDNTFLASEVFAHNPVRSYPPQKTPLMQKRKKSCPKTSVFPSRHGTTSPQLVFPLSSFPSPIACQVLVHSDLPIEQANHGHMQGELFIFPGTKAPTNINAQNIVGSAGLVPTASSYSYHLSLKGNDHETPGGTVKVIDPTIFPIVKLFSAAIVTIKPRALREIHWHTTSDEWNFFISGSARIGIYAAQGNARTFDYVSLPSFVDMK